MPEFDGGVDQVNDLRPPRRMGAPLGQLLAEAAGRREHDIRG